MLNDALGLGAVFQTPLGWAILTCAYEARNAELYASSLQHLPLTTRRPQQSRYAVPGIRPPKSDRYQRNPRRRKEISLIKRDVFNFANRPSSLVKKSRLLTAASVAGMASSQQPKPATGETGQHQDWHGICPSLKMKGKQMMQRYVRYCSRTSNGRLSSCHNRATSIGTKTF